MLAAIDIGTSKTVALIGRRNSDGEVEVAGFGQSDSPGMERGTIVDIGATVKSIKQAVSEAELVSNLVIESCYVGVSGNSVTSITNSGMVTLARQYVQEDDIKRVIEYARTTTKVPSDSEVLHSIPHSYELDSSTRVRDPKGMAATRLDCTTQLICCHKNTLRNIRSCFDRCQIGIDAIVLNQVAESYSVLADSEKKNGVCLVKIGAGTTDIGIYVNNALQYYENLKIGGDLVTSDIASALHTSLDHAEEIKVQYACALGELARDNQQIRIPGIGKHQERNMQRSTLVDYVEPRYEEIFGMAYEAMERSSMGRHTRAGIVLTGGGAMIEGAVDLATQIFRMPVRLGYSAEFESHERLERYATPEFSTAVGLLQYGLLHNYKVPKKTTNKISSLFSVVNRWFQ